MIFTSRLECSRYVNIEIEVYFDNCQVKFTKEIDVHVPTTMQFYIVQLTIDEQ